MIDWSAARDEYCERLGPGLLAEPANALSNAAFFVAAWWLWRMLRREFPQGLPPGFAALPVLVALIGAGSLAYHTFAVAWAELLDVLFIGIYIHYFFACFLRYLVGWPWRWAWIGIPAFALFSWALTSELPPTLFNGSVMYLPALFGILIVNTYLRVQRHPDAWYFIAAATVFVVSLYFRTYDQTWCDRFPLGTHWIWHMLNAVTLTLVTAGLVRGRVDALQTRDVT